MEEVCERENLKQALKRVQANKGAPGVDGMTVQALRLHLREHWPSIRSSLLGGTYQPQPVRRVEIPKPDGGVRKLGIPCALDRFVQQAVLQVLQRRWDPTFSESSYGFRPGRSAHQAVERAQSYIQAGHRWVVDLDLEKFFDRVNHDILMSRIARRISDKRMLKLIRSFLTAGVLENGLVGATDEGTPQGGPLSPLLSNLILDDLDRELARRDLSFVRYADDCNVYVRSERAGLRVMAGLKVFLTSKLKLQVNESKSAVARPHTRKFLGFTFSDREQTRRLIAPKAPHSLLLLEAMETWPDSIRGTHCPWRETQSCRPNRRSTAQRVAAQSQPCSEPRPVKRVLTFSRAPIAWSLADQPIRTAVYGPVRTVVWEGSGREACPYPDRFVADSQEARLWRPEFGHEQPRPFDADIRTAAPAQVTDTCYSFLKITC
ncbi:group II intron reverse transcriptase/maturase [Paraburkholderia sp. CNPSo 3076]|uniref:group II intron reverse transcriptase/maturase n=1 Tax=Paraburkholderia sp. CNPSo 3076 TaxID=2940936 RepID=UPI0022551F41|nr:group II intron reverse transcriptase/maturase [Paraburkholderia sp. CNPSo 3076]